VNKAFVLGAGLGKRLRPLTGQLPKPLIPVFHRPLISYAFDHLLDAGVEAFVVNTHHLPKAYDEAFPDGSYRGHPIAFREETPVLLETAGGIANVRDLLDPDPFFVYNGDILTDLPLQPLLEEHRRQGNLVTLALRSHGPALHIALDRASGKITDIHNILGTGHPGKFLFSGVYLCEPEFHDWITPGKVESVIPIFLEMIRQGAPLGGAVIDRGHWWDLGSRASYLDAHRAIAEAGRAFPAHAATQEARSAVHPDAQLSDEASLSGLNVIGPGAVVDPGAALANCLVWPGAHIDPSARLTDCIVRSGITASGLHSGVDL
jgi:mannose-1-phosphate guanylyltransferase/mannose-1-phosphate guanylyltransferase/phosphomannomutase